jgi:hypothetical protein
MISYKVFLNECFFILRLDPLGSILLMESLSLNSGSCELLYNIDLFYTINFDRRGKFNIHLN